MLRRTLFILGVSLSLVLALRPGGSAMAAPGNLGFTQGCSVNGVGVDAIISWAGVIAGAREVWLDLSEYNNGWVPGTYATTGAMSPTVQSFNWVSLLPNTTYYVRISQLMGVGLWDSSLTYMLTTGPLCYGAPTAPYSTPATPQTHNRGIESFSLQPIDFWVRQAIAAYYTPPRQPILVNAYPSIPTTYIDAILP
ncbi:MAG TPA: hypothetical protein VJB57_10945 [Dehalococcoidia bacterium]|nr:hypothetical protein [Dehalococcoidia bacterium]